LSRGEGQHQGLDGAEAAFFARLQTFVHAKAKPVPTKISRVCAVDAAYRGDDVVAVASVFKDEQLAEKSVYRGHCTFPYVSGLFYLREGPSAVEAVTRLKVKPQLVCFDAHGAAHPRSAGLATICGMVLGIPSVGIAKSLLVGRVVPSAWGIEKIVHESRTVGFVTRVGDVPRYWSPGYSISLGSLRLLVQRHGPACLEMMAESHKTARKEIESESRSPL
jgi:deoxyribonuclease V